MQTGKNPRWNVTGLKRVAAEASLRHTIFGERVHKVDISEDYSDEPRSIEESDPDFSSHNPPALENDRYFEEMR